MPRNNNEPSSDPLERLEHHLMTKIEDLDKKEYKAREYSNALEREIQALERRRRDDMEKVHEWQSEAEGHMNQLAGRLAKFETKGKTVNQGGGGKRRHRKTHKRR
jgi:hypothetical protein